jgi:uncharacterized protein
MMHTHHLFIAAFSGRALAQAAHAAGIACTVADCFGDADTLAFTQHWSDVCAVDALEINAQAVCAALRACAQVHAGAQLIIITGSGFEANLAALKALENTAYEVGALCAFNSSEVLQNLLDPLRFFAAVQASGASHPRTQIEPPEDTQGWLIKQVGGQGATHVRPANQAKFSSANSLIKSIYYQEEHNSCERSICFIAQYSGVVSLGFNLQLVDRTNDQGFCYRGALGGDAQASALPESLRTSLLESLAQLCKHFNLRGLGSLDFIEHEGRAYVLEINARPTATFELYDAKHALIQHLKAFGVQGLSEVKDSNARAPCAGHRYVFAPQLITWNERHAQAMVSTGIAVHMSDWPRLGTSISEGAPLCNLHASGASQEAVYSELLALERELLALIASAEWKVAA